MAKNKAQQEQILLKNPDYVFLSDPQAFTLVTSPNSPWRHLNAVKNKHVYLVPKNLYGWIADPPSINRLLGIYYVAGIMYPEIAKADIREEAKKYYETIGYSPEAIEKAETLYSQYTATPEYKQAQSQGAQSALLSGQTVADVTSSYDATTVSDAIKNISSITDQAAKGVSKQAILSKLGYDVANMDAESQNAAYQKALGMASSNSGRAAFVDNQIKVAEEKGLITNICYITSKIPANIKIKETELIILKRKKRNIRAQWFQL